MQQKETEKLSLLGSVSLGTGVMIGAGIFVLMGQIAELVGELFPLALIAGGIVSGLSAYSYVKFSNAYPSSGGVAKFLRKSYGPGVITGTFSLLMYVSMVIAESLVAKTFGAYSLRLFDIDSSSILVTILAVALIAVAFVVNISGNKIIEATANITAAIKIVGLAILAIVGLSVGVIAPLEMNLPAGTDNMSMTTNFLAALALAVLAYKGFTTITNQGGDIVDPTRNVGRSIVISITICIIIYVTLAISVGANLGVDAIVKAKDYAIAEAARPVFGDIGLWVTVFIAIVATVSGVFASVFSASRLLGMLGMMKQVPGLVKKKGTSSALIFTVLLAMTITVLFDLTRIAAIGAIFYLLMDIAVHWGLVRHLRGTLNFNSVIPVVAIIFDVVILTTFVLLKLETDPLVIAVSVIGFVIIIIAQKLFMKSHTGSDGEMDMGMDDM
ncbi:MAG: APC family permease [Gammaproteobacteria bacterium]|nr:APC family permease [Gammaproteobacteria bacterium]